MGWTCRVAGVEPGVVRASFVSILARAMDCCLAPAMALTLFLGLMTPVYGGTSYHRFASGLGMNIRHLPCVSRRTGEAGTCMFAYSCAKLNGTHLGTCIDRFYFGSCCRLPPGVAPDALEHVNLDDNFIDDNSIATTEKLKPPQSVKPDYTSSITPSTIPPSTAGYVTSQKPSPTTHRPSPSTQRPAPSTQWPSSSSQRPSPSSQRPSPSSHRPSPSTQRPPPSITYPSTLRPSTVQVTSTSIPTKKYPVTTARPPPSPTTPAPTLVTWTTIDGFPPRKPPSVGSGNGVSPASSTTHRTPVTSPAVTVDHNKPTSEFNTTNGAVTLTSPKPSSLYPSSPSRPSVTIISTKPSQRPTTVTRPSGSPSSKPNVVVTTNRPSTLSTSRPSSQKPVPSRPSSKPTFKPTKPSSKPPVKVSVKPSSKPVTSVTIVSTQKPSSLKPTKAGTTGTKPSRPSSQKPPTPSPTKPSTVKPTSSKPVVKPTAKPSPKPTRPKPTKPTKTSTTQKPTPKPTKPSTTRPPTTTTEASTDPDWVQVSVSSHEPSLQTTIYLTTESPWTSVRPGSTEESTLPVTFTTEVPTFTSPTVTSSDNNINSSPSHPSSTVSPTFLPSVDSNEILNVNMSDFKDVCGRRLFPEPRIVGGNKSTFGKWPWQISLRQWRTSTYLHKCGAALLSENWAITAAHCVENVPPSDLLLRLGEYDLSTEEEPYTFQERRVQIVASHPQFDPRTFEYDLALLRFYDPVQFQPNIIPICVPEDDTNFVGKTAHVTGWGRLYEDGPLPMVLQEVSVPVINNTVCETMYRAAGYIEHIPDIFICAGWKKGGFDSCEGDSGGPMVIERGEDKRWILAGVISWGIGCAEPNQPGVYTRISHFRHWINQILQF